MNFDDLDYDERIKAIKNHIHSQQEPWMDPIEVQLYEEQQKNREHNSRSFFGVYGGVVVFIILGIISIFFPSFLANDEHFAVVGKYAISFVIAYILYPLFKDLLNKF